jgi:hypothetical protein
MYIRQMYAGPSSSVRRRIAQPNGGSEPMDRDEANPLYSVGPFSMGKFRAGPLQTTRVNRQKHAESLLPMPPRAPKTTQSKSLI